MSINSITDRFGKKLNLHAENIDSEALLADSISATTINATTSINADTITANIAVSAPVIRSNNERLYTTASDVGLTSSFPLGFISSISDVRYQRDVIEKYDPDIFNYVKLLKIKNFFTATVGLNSGPASAGFYITVYNIPDEFHNSVLEYGRGSLRSTGGVTGSTGFGLWQVNTTVLGEVTWSFSASTHSAVLPGANIVEAEIELRAV
jgi:hypothetical protein